MPSFRSLLNPIIYRRMGVSLLAYGAFSFAQVPTIPPAHAQDWDVQGGQKRRQEIIDRYKKLLEASPVEGFVFDKIIDYVGRGNGLDALIRDYEKKVEARPERLNYRLILGHLLKTKSDYEGALVHYEKAVELGPKDPNTWMSRGSVLVLLQRQKEATADFEEALSLEKNKAKKQDILRKLADAAFAQHDWERAEKYYDELIKLSPRDEYLRLEYAQVLVKYRRYDKALVQYDELIRLSGRDSKKRANTLRDKGDVLERMGKAEEAVEVYRKAMGLMRPSYWLYTELQHRVIDAYRSMDKLDVLVADFAKKWRSPNYDQSMILAGLYDELGDEDSAFKFYQRATAKKSREVEPRLKIIAILKRRGEDQKVVDAYKSLIRVAGNQQRFQFDLVQLYFRMGEDKKAEQELARIASRFSRNPHVYLELADTYMRFDMIDKAQAAYERLVRMSPRDETYILSLGEFYYRQGQLDKAQETWQKLLKTNLPKSEAYALLGQTYAEHGLVDQGLSYYLKAVDLAPDDLEIRRGLANNYVRARRWEQALEAWHTVMTQATSAEARTEARARIISVHEERGYLVQKMDEWTELFAGKDGDAEAGYFLAEARIHRKEYDEAKQAYERLIELDGVRDEKDIEALNSLLRIYNQTGETERSIEVLEELAVLRPTLSRDYYHQISSLALDLYQDDKAIKYALRAVELNPDDAMAQAQLADIYYQMRRFPEAVKAYEKAIDLDPRALRNAMKLADIYLEQREFAKAEALYRNVVKKAEDESLILKSGRIAMQLAEVDGRLGELELEFSPLVFQTRAKPVYRSLMLELYGRMIAPLLMQVRFDGVDEAQRDQAQQAAKRLDTLSRAAQPVLMDALQSDDIAQQTLAIGMLGDLRAGGAAAPLARIATDIHHSLRSLALVQVLNIGDERASSTLIAALSHDDPAMRDTVTWALGYTGGKDAVKALVNVLKNGQNSTQKTLAALSLGRVSGATARAALSEAIKDESFASASTQMRIALAWAVGRSGAAAATASLAKIMENDTEAIAGVAAWSLAQMETDLAFEALLGAYWADSPLQRRYGAIGLLELATEPAPPRERYAADVRETRFLEATRHEFYPDGMIDDLAAQTVAVDGDATRDLLGPHLSAIQAVSTHLLEEGSAAVRRRVLDDLVAMNREHAYGVLAPRDASGRAALDTLMADLTPRVRALVEGANAQLSPELLRPAMQLLGALQEPKTRAVLVGYATHPDPSVRAAALFSLGDWGAKNATANEVIDLLKRSLDDDAFGVRAAAALSLAKSLPGDSAPAAQAAELLVKMLRDDSLLVRQAAAQALVLIGSPEGLSQLGSTMDSLPTAVQISALRALARDGSPAAQKLLAPYQQHRDIRLREAAQQ